MNPLKEEFTLIRFYIFFPHNDKKCKNTLMNNIFLQAKQLRGISTAKHFFQLIISLKQVSFKF